MQSSYAQRTYIQKELIHLRSGGEREWSTFPESARGDSLKLSFEAQVNQRPATLGVRRIDVKEGWQVKLNDQLLGKLFSDENDIEEAWEIEPGVLRSGSNDLLIEATSERIDDVQFGRIWIDSRAREEALAEATVRLSALDEDGSPIPCRFTLLNSVGSLAALGISSGDHLAVRSGVVYSSTGKAEVGLAAGVYTVYCGRGFEYDLEKRELEVHAGDAATLEFALRRVVDTAGLVACDTHVHTFEISRHGDASLAERMITLAGEGIELAIATDHNVFIDYEPYLERMGLKPFVASMIGNEVTTKFGHFNIFPAQPDAPLPNHNTDSWKDLLAEIYATPNVRVAILNHPRDVHSGFTPFASQNMIDAVGERLDGRELHANAVELINSAAMQTDPMVVFHDWLTQVNRGLSLTAVGSSDSHEVSRKIVGQGRSYIYANDGSTEEIDFDEVVEAFVKGRVLVSLGLLTEIEVRGTSHSGDEISISDEQIPVQISVRGPPWVRADRCELFANGQLVRSFEISEDHESARGIKTIIRTTVDKPSHDLHLVAIARGPGVEGLYWTIAKPYQPNSKQWQSYVFGSSGIVRVDADGDGEWTSAKGYAERFLATAQGDIGVLLEQLKNCDEAISAFSAREWQNSGKQLRDPLVLEALEHASKEIQAGFRRVMESERRSLEAG